MRDVHTIIIHDLAVAGLSLWLTLYLRFGATIPAEYSGSLVYGTAVFVVIAGIMFYSFGMYRALLRYASIPDLIAIVRAVTVSLLAFWLMVYATAWLDTIPRSLPIIQWLLLVVMLGGLRIIIRISGGDGLLSPLRRRTQRTPVLLAGTTGEASMFVRATYESDSSPFRVLGILDDTGRSVGRSLHRVPVLGRLQDLRNVVSRLAVSGDRPSQLVIATDRGSIAPEAFARLMDEANSLGLDVGRVPSMSALDTARAGAATELCPVKLEDLLGRPQIELDQAPIARLIAGRRVLITGAGGSIGSELARQIAALAPAELILLDACEFHLYNIDQEIRGDFPEVSTTAVLCSVRDAAGLERVCSRHAPELVFHAAALKHVPLVEDNPCDGILTNAIGTRIVADAALRHHATGMIQISTDKAIEPQSVMGASKHLAENYCQALDVASGRPGWGQGRSRFITVRFGNVLGSSGSVVPLFQRQLSRGGPLTVTHPEMRRFFMTIGEAVELVLHASAYGIDQPEHRGQIFVLDMGQPTKIVDIARQLIRLAGLNPDIDVKILFTGLRRGERLDEQLFSEQEKQIPTSVDGVLRAVSPARDLSVVRRELDELGEVAAQHRPKALRRLLSQLVPSYPARQHEEPAEAEAIHVFERAHERISSFVTPPIPVRSGVAMKRCSCRAGSLLRGS